MRLSVVTKLALALTLGNSAVLAAYGWFAISRETELFRQAKRDYGEVLGSTLAKQMAENWKQQGKPQALELLAQFETHHREIKIRWVPLAGTPSDASDPYVDASSRAKLKTGTVVTLEKADPRGGVLSFYTLVPVPLEVEDAGAIEVVESLQDSSLYTAGSVRRLVAALGGFILAAAGIALAMSRWLVGRPIGKLIEKTKQVAKGDHATAIDVQQNDEIGDLAAAMTRMSEEMHETRQRLSAEEEERRRTELQLRHADRLTTVGKLAAGVAHEIGTPMNVILGRAKRLERPPGEVDVAQQARIIREQVEKVTKIVRQLLDFARRKGPETTELDVSRLLPEIAELLQTTVRKHNNVELRVHAPKEPLSLVADALQVQQVLSNLVLNAAQAMPSGGPVEIGAERLTGRPAGAPESVPHGEYIRLYVRDEGVGIPPENLARIFEPFFTTKGVGEGTGLGLSVVYGIVKDHDGWVHVDSQVGKGTCFSVFLPQNREATAAA